MKNQQPPEDSGAVLRVEEIEDGRWNWSYTDPAADMTLHSNETYSSRDVAMDWARRAYPGVPFAEEQD